MNKKIIVIIIILIFSLGICYYFLRKEKNNQSINTNINYSENSHSTNFSNYEEININLDEVNDIYKITNGGVYRFTGSFDKYILIDTELDVKITLDNVTINNTSGPCIYGYNSKNIYIELIGENTLSDGTTYKGIDEEVSSVIFSNDDLIFSGEGTLNINANYNDGISSDDDIIIKNGIFNIKSVDDAIRGKDSVVIENGVVNINSGGDGIKSTNDTDSSKGYILIKNGTFDITSVNDAIDASTDLEIENGVFNIKTGNGSTGAVTKNNFGNIKTSNNTESAKGLKADNSIIIKNINITINSSDDGIHSDNTIKIENGTIKINSDDDAIHADGMIEIDDGTIEITAGEGIEATYVKINGGNININASDDGINAGNKSKNYTTTIEINGGNITIKMGGGDTDAIDSNGNIYINGGTIDITGNSPFDYDGEAKYNGGTIIVNGVTTNTITNQMMGGGMGNPGGNMPGGGNMNGRRR